MWLKKIFLDILQVITVILQKLYLGLKCTILIEEKYDTEIANYK